MNSSNEEKKTSIINYDCKSFHLHVSHLMLSPGIGTKTCQLKCKVIGAGIN